LEVRHLKDIATDFRKALVAVVQENTEAQLFGFPICEFPRGACGEASMLLATYYREQHCGAFEYYFGIRNGRSHAWLGRGNLIIDITADQFEDEDRPVIVTTDHSWHNQFRGEIAGSAYFDSVSEPRWRSAMQRFYDSIVWHIEANISPRPSAK